MDVIILAAGRGRRIQNLLDKRPKCMLQVGDRLLIDYLIDSLLTLKIEKITLCIGFGSKYLKRHLQENFQTVNFKFVYNPVYRFTNNSLTLWLARKKGSHDFLIINGDNLLDGKLIREVANYPGTVIPIVKKASYDPEDMKVSVNSQGYIKQISKNITSDIFGEAIGIRKIARDDEKIFWKSLRQLIFKQLRPKAFYTEAFQICIQRGVKIPNLDVSEYYCDEIDDETDLRRIRNNYPKLESAAALNKS